MSDLKSPLLASDSLHPFSNFKPSGELSAFPYCITSIITIIIILFLQTQSLVNLYPDPYTYIVVPIIVCFAFSIILIFLLLQHKYWKQQGHLNYYYKTLSLVKAPVIISICSVILLINTFVFLISYKSTLSLIIISVQNILSLISIGLFLYYTFIYCKQSNNNESFNKSEMEEIQVLRQQAIRVTHLEEQLENLNKQLLHLQQDAEKTKIHNTSGDIQQLLAAKDQQIRGLSAQRDHLQNDLDKTTKIAEILRKNVTSLVNEIDEMTNQRRNLEQQEQKLNKECQRLKLLLEVQLKAKNEAAITFSSLKKSIDQIAGSPTTGLSDVLSSSN